MPKCNYIHDTGIPCDNKVMTKPDKSQPSVYLRCQPQSSDDSIERFVYVFPEKIVSDYCFYHDRIISKLMESHRDFYTHTNKLRYRQSLDNKVGRGKTIFTTVPLHLR